MTQRAKELRRKRKARNDRRKARQWAGEPKGPRPLGMNKSLLPSLVVRRHRGRYFGWCEACGSYTCVWDLG